MIELDLRIRRGQFELAVSHSSDAGVVGVFGPSGSGKTTLLNCIAGVARADAGRIAVGDRVLFDSKSGIDVAMESRRIGYVFQDSLLFPHMSVRENLVYGRPRAGSGPALEDVIMALELDGLLDRRPSELSGGEQRRVSVGRAILSNPGVLLFDEPLTGLDSALASRVLARLKRVLTQFAIPSLYVSHTVSDMLFLCDEVIALRTGQVVARGAARDVLMTGGVLAPSHWAELRNVFTARTLERRQAEGEATAVCRVGDVDLVVFAGEGIADAPTLSVHAADIVLSREKPGGLSARNVFPAKVESVVASGEKRLILADAGERWMVEVSAAAIRELGLSPGTPIFLILKTSSIRVC